MLEDIEYVGEHRHEWIKLHADMDISERMQDLYVEDRSYRSVNTLFNRKKHKKISTHFPVKRDIRLLYDFMKTGQVQDVVYDAKRGGLTKKDKVKKKTLKERRDIVKKSSYR